MKLSLFFFLFIGFILKSVNCQISLKSLPPIGCYTNLRISNDRLVYGSLDTSGVKIIGSIYQKCLKSNSVPKLLIKDVDNHFLEFYNENQLLFVKLQNGIKNLYCYNFDRNTETKLVSLGNNLYSSSLSKGGDDIIYTTTPKNKYDKWKTWRYNLITRKLIFLDLLKGKQILKTSYEEEHNMLAYIKFDSNTFKSILELLINDKTYFIDEYTSEDVSSETPICFKETDLFYIINKNDTCYLKKYSTIETKTEIVLSFPKGIKCRELSIFENKFLMAFNANFDDKIISRKYKIKFTPYLAGTLECSQAYLLEGIL